METYRCKFSFHKSCGGFWCMYVFMCVVVYLAPSHYHLFPELKKQLKGRHFSSDTDVIAAASTWLDGQHSEFF